MHKTKFCAILALALALGLPAAPAAAGEGEAAAPRPYDRGSEITVVGTVEEVSEAESPMGFVCLHLRLRTGAVSREVCLGPASFVAEKGFEFAPGDEIQVIGSSFSVDEGLAILAREVEKGRDVLRLRNWRGKPLWSGRGERPAP